MTRILICFSVAAISLAALSMNLVTAQESSDCCQYQNCSPCHQQGIDLTVKTLDTPSESNGCCQVKKADQQFSVQISCGTDIPFLSNVPYINRLFKNVGISRYESSIEPHAQFDVGSCAVKACSARCQKKCCRKNGEVCEGTDKCGSAAFACRFDEDPARRALQLVKYSEEVRERKRVQNEKTQELVELQVENARLQVELEAMEAHMELVSEMSEVREENAALRAKLEMMEAQTAQMTAIQSRYHVRHTAPVPARVRTVLPPTALQPVPQVPTPPVVRPVNSAPLMLPPAQPKVPCNPQQPQKCGSACKVQRLMEQVQQLKQELNEIRSCQSRTATNGR